MSADLYIHWVSGQIVERLKALAPYPCWRQEIIRSLKELIELKNPRWQEQPRVPSGHPDGGQWTDGATPAGFPAAAIGAVLRETIKQVGRVRAIYRRLLALAPLDVPDAYPPRLPPLTYAGAPSLRRPGLLYLEFDYYWEFWLAMGSAGKGYNWHHVVEQSTVVNGQFPGRAVHNTDNIVRVTVNEHRCINKAYAPAGPGGGGERDRLRGNPWQEHFTRGLEILRRCRNATRRKR